MEVIKFPKFKRSPIVTILPHDDDVDEPVVTFGPARWRPLQKLTEDQFNSVPQTFRCFYCLELRPRKCIGGIEVDQYVCKFCYPYTGEGWARRLIKWSIWHNHPIREGV